MHNHAWFTSGCLSSWVRSRSCLRPSTWSAWVILQTRVVSANLDHRFLYIGRMHRSGLPCVVRVVIALVRGCVTVVWHGLVVLFHGRPSRGGGWRMRWGAGAYALPLLVRSLDELIDEVLQCFCLRRVQLVFRV